MWPAHPFGMARAIPPRLHSLGEIANCAEHVGIVAQHMFRIARGAQTEWIIPCLYGPCVAQESLHEWFVVHDKADSRPPCGPAEFCLSVDARFYGDLAIRRQLELDCIPQSLCVPEGTHPAHQDHFSSPIDCFARFWAQKNPRRTMHRGLSAIPENFKFFSGIFKKNLKNLSIVRGFFKEFLVNSLKNRWKRRFQSYSARIPGFILR